MDALLDTLAGALPHAKATAFAEPLASPGFTGGATVWRSTKTYGHEEGLSCCFRQWRATHSHCRLLHGYALLNVSPLAGLLFDAALNQASQDEPRSQ